MEPKIQNWGNSLHIENLRRIRKGAQLDTEWDLQEMWPKPHVFLDET